MVVGRDQFSRTVILGNGGSGKSWLAGRLASAVGASATDLDSIHWLPGGFNARRDPALAVAMVREAASRERWILEGVYGWLAEPALPRATALILLDIDDRECVANVRARGLRDGEDEASLASLVDWIADYRVRQNANSFHRHEQLFDRFEGAKRRLTSRDQIAAELASITATDASSGP
jgi:adenylate kinase family enzyme